MPRRKIAMRLIEKPRARRATYARRTKGLEKKALELSTLCAVSVALVCGPAAGAGAGAPLVWESEEGVLDRYRGTAIPPDTRAQHTHRSYLEGKLGKERAKLARTRPAALPDWDEAFNNMTLAEARAVLDAMDATLGATRDRMEALGLPADGDGQLEIEQVAASDGDGDASGVVPQDLGLQQANMAMGAGFQMQMMPWQGGGSYDETQAPGGYGDSNAGCAWPDLTMSYAADESWVPGGYYPDFTDGVAAPNHYSAQDVTGGDMLPFEYPMGMDENLTYIDMGNSYAANWQPEEFQLSDNVTDTGAGQYQNQCSDPGTCCYNQAFHYHYY
uniref:Uncharacterized protein n=1 Tax=Avena sativa TaxID=4498 RepID=A0ACD5YJB5_AVESA